MTPIETRADQTRIARGAVTVELVSNGLAAIAEEMAITHVRASYSTVVRDMLDFSTAVTDGGGRVLAQGLSLALQLGAIPRFMRELVASGEPVRPGDVFLVNHPWQGGVHLPDFFFAKPVFVGDDPRPLAYAVIVSHMLDVGGSFPGGVAASAASLWEEGLVVPRLRLVDRDVLNEPLMDLIAANSREPVKVRGDVRAALAGLETGARQILAMAGRMGPVELRADMEEMLARSELATRAAIARLPDGSGDAEDWLDDDGVGGSPVRFVCEATKRGDRLHFDFTGTSHQLASGINTTVADVWSVVAFVTRAALREELDVNDGFYGCLDFSVPLGTVVNARYPAAVGSRAASIYRLVDVALAALAQFAPDRVPASDGGPGVLYFSGDRPDGSSWIYLDYVQAGWGATPSGPGVPGVSHPISNAANIPGEILEQEFPLRLLRYGLQPGTGGAGRFDGAPAVVREYEALEGGTRVNLRFERMHFAPPGARGGHPGSRSRCEIAEPGASYRETPGKGTHVLAAGARIRVQLASGGGFGDPPPASASVPGSAGD
jgi:N-methylhydantoinase B